MATAYAMHPSSAHPVHTSEVRASLYAHDLGLEAKDNRYPDPRLSSITPRQASMPTDNSWTPSPPLAWEEQHRSHSVPATVQSRYGDNWVAERSADNWGPTDGEIDDREDTVVGQSQPLPSAPQTTSEMENGVAFPAGQPSPPANFPPEYQPVVSPDRASSQYFTPNAIETPQQYIDSTVLYQPSEMRRTSSGGPDRSIPIPSAPRYPSLPMAGVGANANSSSRPGSAYANIMPLSASPSYDPSSRGMPPISQTARASAQFPTYVTPPSAPKPVNPVYAPALPVPKEEVCLECAMRDEDMVDVDVTTPGVWARESDVYFLDLVEREQQEEASGTRYSDSEHRPRSKGGLLTEQHMKIWHTINPKEPAARQMTLDAYIKSQRTLLEADALAHARAMQESRQIDNRMRDTYSQLRRSAYDTGSSAAPVDDVGGVRINPPRSASAASGVHLRNHSRDVTLLENGMIVEHVNVKREEKEERDRRRKEERRGKSRARKSSRASGADMSSLLSANSFLPPTDSGIGLGPNSRYSVSSQARPNSVLTAPMDGTSGSRALSPGLPRAYSQASFSDAQSIISATSPRRSRFFGFKNASSFRSQDSLAMSGMSGSMVDMHVALQREAAYTNYPGSPMASQSPLTRTSQIWPTSGAEPVPQPLRRLATPVPAVQPPPKKKRGLAKIWQKVTGGGSKNSSQAVSRDIQSHSEKPEDDLPLAPPPPLSYLVEHRRRGDSMGGRNASSPSLPSVTSARQMNGNPGTSPSSAASTLFPSPVSSRPSPSDRDLQYNGKVVRLLDEEIEGLPEDYSRLRNVHPMLSEPDMRVRMSQAIPESAPSTLRTKSTPRPMSTIMSRQKTLPPLPGESQQMERQPQNSGAHDSRQIPFGAEQPNPNAQHNALQSPLAPFRGGADTRRQSFAGVTSRPVFASQTMPNGMHPQYNPNGPYSEFGVSRHSVGNLLDTPRSNAASPTPTMGARRRSRFGISALLNRKSRAMESEDTSESPGTMTSDEMMHNRYPTSNSRHSVGPRTSINGRKPIEELVSVAPDFVAYRYPDGQPLDLMR